MRTDDISALTQTALRAFSEKVGRSCPEPCAILIAGEEHHELRADAEDAIRTTSARVVVLIEMSADPDFDSALSAVSAEVAVCWKVMVAYDNRDCRVVDVEVSQPCNGHTRLRDVLGAAGAP